jgi:hypothetical protein
VEPSILKPHTWPQRLIICIALAELGYGRFPSDLSNIEGFGWFDWKDRVFWHTGGYVHGAHNNLIKAIKERDDYDRVVFLEHDHEFPVDTLWKHAHYTKPIVSATYVLRDYSAPLPVFYNWDAERHNALHPNVAEVKHMLDNPGLHEVDVVPMGCTSIKREVFETWPSDQPMFNSFTNPRGNTMSDDVWFCRMAQDNGWQPYVDTSLQIGHLALVPLTIQTFVSYWNMVGSKQAIKDVEAKAS